MSELIARHGYWIVAAAIGIESMGIPVPGETILVTAAIYAGATHQLNIVTVIVGAIIGAIAGDNVGFAIGRRFGYPLLLRHGHLFKLTASRIKLGRFLFLRHGGKVVFFGRFIAVLRALAAVLAGINCMPWRRFLVFNAVGGIVWSGGYGTLAYLLGTRVEQLAQPAAVRASPGCTSSGSSAATRRSWKRKRNGRCPAPSGIADSVSFTRR